MTGFTKGPWYVHRAEHIWTDCLCIGTHPDGPQYGCALAYTTRGFEGDGSEGDSSAQANARLIAAAPDLYEALRSVGKVIVAYLNDAGASIEDLNACVNSIDAALAKATGAP